MENRDSSLDSVAPIYRLVTATRESAAIERGRLNLRLDAEPEIRRGTRIEDETSTRSDHGGARMAV